jgi:hypothetical protein
LRLLAGNLFVVRLWLWLRLRLGFLGYLLRFGLFLGLGLRLFLFRFGLGFGWRRWRQRLLFKQQLGNSWRNIDYIIEFRLRGRQERPDEAQHQHDDENRPQQTMIPALLALIG